jgi:putative peptidoglycan lipid II flippase
VRSFEHEDGGDGFASRLITTISLILLVLVLLGMYFYAEHWCVCMHQSSLLKGFQAEKEIAIAFTRYCSAADLFPWFTWTMLGCRSQMLEVHLDRRMSAPIANNLVGIALFGGFFAALTRVVNISKYHRYPGSNSGMGNNAQCCRTSLGFSAGY